MSGFDSLTWAFEDWFDRPLNELPGDLRQRVEREFFPMPWDSLSADQRRSVALQLDCQRDPATKQDRQAGLDFFDRKCALERQVEEWRRVAAPTAGELAIKESRLRELGQELARMERQLRQARGDYYPKRPQADDDDSELPAEYIPYPKAMKSLAARLDATPEELAAWVWLGPTDGGLAAYRNASELDSPPRFYYDIGNAEGFDYLAPLMACWFSADDIANFDPADRFITGQALIERWNKPGIQPEAFIRAKIAESRLMDHHPIYGGTQGTSPEDAGFPPLADGLFSLSHVEKIEAEDFDVVTGADEVVDSSPCKPVEASLIRLHFRVINDDDTNDHWWKEKMADAKRYGLVECRVGEGKKGRGGGSLWKPAMIAGWLVDRQESGKDGLTAKAARQALKKFSGCADLADERFPLDD